MSKLTPPVNKDDHTQGPSNALITLVEYGDYQCPHCGAAHPVIKTLQESFGNKLRLVFRHFPLSNVHPLAMAAAIAAEAAGKQQHFWEMHDMIFEHQAEISRPTLLQLAMELRLNTPIFKMDLQNETLIEKVENQFESGARSGVNGTPSFFINGYKYNGGYDFESLYTIIDQNILALH